MKKLNLLFAGFLVCGAMFVSSCVGDDNPVNPTNNSRIPDDKNATPNPILDPTSLNTFIPNFNWNYEMDNGDIIIRLDLTGVKDPYTNDWVELYGTDSDKQNIWLSVDGKAKGFTIEKVRNDNKAVVDLVFLVDNSGSMSEEANAVARDIIAWSEKLSSSLDIRFACVGYSVSGTINGAFDFAGAPALGDYLNRSSGTSRTMGYGGDYATELQAAADEMNQDRVSNECGVMALKYADKYLRFRNGANRIYVNFTDEPNQPSGKEYYSTEWVKETANWPSTKGTIHTVYSDYNNWTQTINYKEYPWNLSEYTGGTTIFASSSFTGVTLDELPVTGALMNSYIIRFKNVPLDGRVHKVWLTVKSTSPNGEILADKESDVIFQ